MGVATLDPLTMRIGVLGAGRIGQFHARTLHAHPAVDTLVVYDPDQSRLAAVVGATDCDLADGVSSLLSQVDAVVISASTHAHAELLEAAVRAGVPAFCEKPVTLDLASTRRLRQLVEERHATVQVGFQRRFDAGYLAARDSMQRGALGKLYSLRVAGHDPAPPLEAYLPGSGGIFRDLFVHDFDIVPWVTGHAIEEVYVQGAVMVDEMFSRHHDVDTVAGTLRLSSGTLGVLTGGRHDPVGYDIRLELFGSLDSVAVGWDARTPLRSLEPEVTAPADPYRGFLDRFAPAYRAEQHAFLALCAGNIENPCPIADAEQALCVAMACDRSRRDGRPVLVSELEGD